MDPLQEVHVGQILMKKKKKTFTLIPIQKQKHNLIKIERELTLLTTYVNMNDDM